MNLPTSDQWEEVASLLIRQGNLYKREAMYYGMGTHPGDVRTTEDLTKAAAAFEKVAQWIQQESSQHNSNPLDKP